MFWNDEQYKNLTNVCCNEYEADILGAIYENANCNPYDVYCSMVNGEYSWKNDEEY